jgi:hypothetical protein
VDWIDDADSRVKLVATAVADLRGIVRLGTGLARGTIKVPALGDPSPPGSRQSGGAPARRRGLLATIVRFGLYRSWVFRGRSHHLNRKAK